MEMMRYPKVPRHGLPFVDREFWEGELVAMEKADGSLFRFAMYDETHAEAYPDTVTALDPADGDIVAGTSDHVRWVVDSDGVVDGCEPDTYGNQLAAVAGADRDAIRDLHGEYGPLVFFGEAMTGHLLEYGDTPPVVGFDVYAPRLAGRDTIGVPERHAKAHRNPAEYHDDPDVPTVERDGEIVFGPEYDGPHPYDLRWDGFLAAEDALDAFADAGLSPVHQSGEAPRVDADEVDPDTMTIPMSQYADVKAEGVVFRNPRARHRVKVRSDVFEEVKNHHHETPSGGTANAVDRFMAEYATPVRIMKTVLKMVDEDGRELSPAIIDDARHRVYDDIWAEEWRTIKEKSYPIVVPAIKKQLARKTADVVQTMVEDGTTLHPEEVAEDAPFTF